MQFLQLKREQLYDWSRVSDMHFRHLAKEAKAPRNNFTVRPAKRLPLVCMRLCALNKFLRLCALHAFVLRWGM